MRQIQYHGVAVPGKRVLVALIFLAAIGGVSAVAGEVARECGSTTSAEPARLERVVLRDSNGNGYPDRVELQFDQFVSLTPEHFDRIAISLRNQPVGFAPGWVQRSERLVPGTLLHVGLLPHTTGPIQWDWVVEVSIRDIPAIADVAAMPGEVRLGDVGESYPFPFVPGPGRVREGELHAWHESQARRWVETDRYGGVLPVAVLVPPSRVGRGRIRARLSIHDVGGNLVHSAHHDDFLQSADPVFDHDNGGVLQASLYWNGYNDRGMAVAPGLYRGVVHLDYDCGSTTAERRVVTRIGVGR